MEIPDNIFQTSGISVVQGEGSLSEDGSRGGCYPLATLSTAVKVQVTDSGVNHQTNIPLGDGNWLLLKLSGRGLERGRKVEQVSSGSYLAIVPENWQRDEEKSGSPPAAPEPVFLDGYLAHFFQLDNKASTCIAFRDENGKEIIKRSGGPRFSLVGNQIADASERPGPLFGVSPPGIRIENGHWSDIGTIVVGQEGSGRRRWRMSFEPKPDQEEQELPHEVLDRKAGWYFLRFYDPTDTLIDSLDFRFVAGLEAVSIPTAGPVPSPDGQVAQRVEIVHDAGYRMRQLGQECPGLKTEQGAGKTILTIPPRADCDRTRWYIHPPKGHGQIVEFTILIERVWWALGGDDTEPSQWGDRCVQLTPEDFSAASGRAIWLRFPKPRWVNNVSAGFAPERARKFPVKVTDTLVSIPLRDFAGAQELDDRGHDHKFTIWLETEQGTHEITLAILEAVAQMTSDVLERGRYKTAIAEARLHTGAGRMNVNGVPIDEYFSHTKRKARSFVQTFSALPEVKRALSQMDIDVMVRGSNSRTMRQAKAVVHAMTRALWRYDRKLVRPLKQAGFGGVAVPHKQSSVLGGGVDDGCR